MDRLRRLCRNSVVLISLGGLLASILAIVIARDELNLRSDLHPIVLAIGAIWFVGVPLWFLVEWAWFDCKGESEFEQFKYTQSLARQFWLSVAAVLAFLIGLDLSGASNRNGVPDHLAGDNGRWRYSIDR